MLVWDLDMWYWRNVPSELARTMLDETKGSMAMLMEKLGASFPVVLQYFIDRCRDSDPANQSSDNIRDSQ